MKKIFTLLGICLSGSIWAQVNFTADTMDVVLHHGFEAESKLLITNNGTSPLDYKYTLLLDQFKGTPGWTVLMCDCENCIENYPDTGTCRGLAPSESWLFNVYVTDKSTSGPPPVKYFTIALNNPNNPSDADTITLRTQPGQPMYVASANTDNALRIYPNPAVAQVNIELPKSSGVAKARLLSLSGAEVLQLQFSERATLSTGHLPRGMYILSVQTSVGVYVQKLRID
jgi:hypothetical protein